MSPELAQMIREVLLEGIKILGPAFFTYLAASAQFRSSLREAEKGHEFKAREHLFAYYQSRQVKLAESYAQISTGLGQLLGFVTALESGESSSEGREAVESFKILMRTHLAVAPFEVEITLRDMKAKQLAELDEYHKLKSYRKQAEALTMGSTLDDLRLAVSSLMEVYAFLERGNQLLLEHQVESVFKTYVRA